MNISIREKLRTAILLAGMAAMPAVTGCSLLTSSEPPPATYVLHPALSGKIFADTAPVTLEVPNPSLPVGFETDRIALYWDQGRRLDYYAGAKWPSQLDTLLQDFIEQSAGHELPRVTVVGTELSLPSQYRLSVKVIELQPVYSGGPVGTPDLYAALRFTLISLPDEKVREDFTVAEHGQAQADNLTAVTGGLESLLQKIMPQALERIAPSLRRTATPHS